MKRSTLIMITVCVALLVAAVLINDRPAQRGSERLQFVDLELDSVDGLLLEGAEGRIELSRSEGLWTFDNGRLADADTIQRALEGLQDIDTSDVVSVSEERQAKYGVDPDGGVTVSASRGGTKLARVVVGSSETGEAYVREVGEAAIFHADAGLAHRFPLDQSRWLKLNLVDGKLEDVTKVRVEATDGAAYAIVPADGGEDWRLEDASVLPADFRFDGPGARSLANAAVTIRAKELVEAAPGAEVTGFEGPHHRVTVTTADGETVVHIGAGTEANDHFVRVDGRDALFLVPTYQANNLRKGIADLRDLRIMDIDVENATALRVGAGRGILSFVKGEDGAWQADPDGVQPPADFSFDATSVDRFVRSLTGLKATALADGASPAAAGLNRPTAQVAVTFANGSVAMLELGKEVKGDDDRTLVYARGNADDKVYTVAEYHRDRFIRGWENFEVVEPPPNMGGGNPWGNLDPETLKNLPPEVRQQIMQQMQQEQQKQRLMQQMQAQQGGAPK